MSEVLFAYVDDSGLEGVATELESRFRTFLASRSWISPDAWVVNQRQSAESVQPPDVPEWNLGINLTLPQSTQMQSDWFFDVEAIVAFLIELFRETGRSFVIGLSSSLDGISEDIAYVDSEQFDLPALRRALIAPAG